jgi:hypothetical protein
MRNIILYNKKENKMEFEKLTTEFIMKSKWEYSEDSYFNGITIKSDTKKYDCIILSPNCNFDYEKVSIPLMKAICEEHNRTLRNKEKNNEKRK